MVQDIDIQQAGMALQVVQVIFVLLSIGASVIYTQCRDGGFILLCLVFFISGATSFILSSWLPVLLGGAIAGLMVFIGSGGLSIHD